MSAVAAKKFVLKKIWPKFDKEKASFVVSYLIFIQKLYFDLKSNFCLIHLWEMTTQSTL